MKVEIHLRLLLADDVDARDLDSLLRVAFGHAGDVIKQRQFMATNPVTPDGRPGTCVLTVRDLVGDHGNTGNLTVLAKPSDQPHKTEVPK